MHMTGDPGRESLKNGGYMSDYQTGLNAFSATAIATLGAQLHGEGDHVDVGAMQCQASVLEGAMPYWCYLGTDSSMRRGNIMASFIGLYPSADGQIGIHAMASNWDALLQTIDMPELGQDDRFRTQAERLHDVRPAREAAIHPDLGAASQPLLVRSEQLDQSALPNPQPPPRASTRALHRERAPQWRP